MKGYDIHLQIQSLKQEIAELSEEILELGHDHPDVPHLDDLLWKSENELDQLMDQDVVEQF